MLYRNISPCILGTSLSAPKASRCRSVDFGAYRIRKFHTCIADFPTQASPISLSSLGCTPPPPAPQSHPVSHPANKTESRPSRRQQNLSTMKPPQNQAAWKDGAPHNHFQLQPQTPAQERISTANKRQCPRMKRTEAPRD